MALFTVENLTFSYPEQTVRAIDDLTLTVPEGAFVVLCGPSGCGKSTLLRQLKPALAPHGVRSGRILFRDTPLEDVDERTQAARIGFVQQSPENQIVTDKVWHELAFGLESLGEDTPTIRRRVAEMASFFGIEGWFYKDVTELSGGQKQLLNLAAVMAMQPNVLILDEPTSQLDPIAASDFLAVLGKINRELGTTVLLTEHRLEEAFPLATAVAVMDGGRLLCTGTPAEVGQRLKAMGHRMFLAMPAAMRIWAAVASDAPCPVTVREGRDFLQEFAAHKPLLPLTEEPKQPKRQPVITVEGAWFRYEENSPDVVKGLDLQLGRGEFLALLGGNGAGKSTTLKLLSGLKKPYRGDITVSGTLGMLPQNPQTLFVKKTVREDLFEIFSGSKLPKQQQEERVARMVRLCRLDTLLDRHPYDLSGGEQQRAALAKVLLLQPEILLLDEPTKGLDAEFKQLFAEILRALLSQGVSLLMVSHDVEFCARYAHRCALFFDGSIVTEASPRAFFSGNSFYTTAANRIARPLEPQAVTAEDVMTVCGGHVPPMWNTVFLCGNGLPPMPELPQDAPPLPEPAEETPDWKPKKLPLWRKALAAVSGAGALAIFLYAASITELSSSITAGGLTALGEKQLGLYALFCVLLLVLALAIGRRSRPPVLAQMPVEKRKLPRRTVAMAVSALLLIPVTLFIGVFYLQRQQYAIVSVLVLFECMLPFFLVFEGRRPQARELVIIAVLCAISVAGRAAFFMLPQFKPVMAMTIIAGVALGGESGFLVGALSMLVSNMFFSQGPWTPWQMFCMGIIGFLAGVLFRKGWLRRTRGSLCVFGVFSAIVIYGGIMNPASVLMWANTETLTWKMVLTYYVTGFPLDCVHAAATAFFLWIAAEPMLEKLDRIKLKYGLME